jgi:hypothetical protein
VLELHLIQQGYLQRTPRGWMNRWLTSISALRRRCSVQRPNTGFRSLQTFVQKKERKSSCPV